jgi:predicted GNAT family acetyltransferase
MSDDPPVVNNEAEHRFEVEVDGHLSELVYRQYGDRLVISHTGVPDALEGHGIGGVLVAAAVDQAAQHGWTVVPICPFARGWLERHPEVASRVKVDWGREPD